jgi:hypothetical protein
MDFILDYGHIPGRIRRVPSTRFPGVQHWGVEGWSRDMSAQPTIWHAQKNDVLRCTSYSEFSFGQPSEIIWTPQSYAQQVSVIQRLGSIEGLPWNLASANCEQIVRWAVEGEARSDQLAFGAVVALSAIALALIATGRRAA